MISEKAKQSFSTIFDQAVEEVLTEQSLIGDCKTVSVSDPDAVGSKEFIILSICSFFFRLFVTLHFTYNNATVDFVADILKVSPEQVDRNQFYDFWKEFGNNFCGAIKRDIGMMYPHLGMSTPDVLDADSFPYLTHLKYELGFNALTSKKKVVFYFGLFVCPYCDLDFVFKKPSNVNRGELELF